MNSSASFIYAEEMSLSDAGTLIPGIVVESALFGTCLDLVDYSIYYHSLGMKFGPRLFLLSATLFMYIASATHWSLNLYTLMRELQDPQAWTALPSQQIYLWSLVTTVALFFNFWISDMIVMWRACTICGWPRFTQIVFAFFVILPVIFSLIDVSRTHATPNKLAFEPDSFGITALIISLISNLWATSLVGRKAWFHRKDIRSRLGRLGQTTAVGSILILLTESGVLYSCIWALFIIGAVYTLIHGPNRVTHAIAGAVPQLVGLYPTLIILLVYLQKSHWDHKDLYDKDKPVLSTMVAVAQLHSASVASMQFRRNPLAATATSAHIMESMREQGLQLNLTSLQEQAREQECSAV
ncbi:hypothetical protein BDP27DRAFT_1431081 [Rhodocollybia butyracea]|uniref:Uncharacterized protein n=1 Tax=Rhodocollybia butyracea TaxID=206335 RepID=A0A9P5TYA9_9AGAR|nr:hypothetical protein BDP27DRAFT_1431081 [Rhodocollybia butyracea]